MTDVSEREAREIVAALRTGVVPQDGLHHFATGLDSLLRAVDQELDEVAAGSGSGRAKWIRGSYGSGKTFATRLLCWHSRQRGFATSEAQISVTDTPLHRLETVYRRIIEWLTTQSAGEGAFQAIVDTWLYQLGDEVMRLQGDVARLTEVGRKVRALYPAENPARVRERVSEPFLEQLVEKTTSAFGGRVEVVPRLFLRELVDVMDRVDQYGDYDPFSAYNFAVSEAQMTPEELAALHGEDTAEDAAGDSQGGTADGERGKELASGDPGPQPMRLD